MSKTLFLLRGLPGAGKTTVGNLLSEHGKYPVISADMYFEDLEGNYNFNINEVKDAHKWCRKCVIVMMQNEILDLPSDYDYNKIFVANTFTEEWEMEEYFKLAEIYDYQVVTMIIENRHGSKNIHNVPDETIEKMRNRFQIKL